MATPLALSNLAMKNQMKRTKIKICDAAAFEIKIKYDFDMQFHQ